MKKLVTILVFVVFTMGGFAQDTIYLPCHLLKDGSDFGTYPYRIYTADYTYNINGLVTKYISNYYDNSLGTCWTYGYDDAGKLIKFFHGSTIGGGDHTRDSTRYEYDGDLLIRKKTGYFVYSNIFKWSGKEEYQYDAFGRCILIGSFTIDLYDDWILSTVTTYEYSDDGLEQVMTHTKVDKGIQYRYIRHYDADGNLINVTYLNSDQGELVNNTYTEYQYHNGLLQHTTKKVWSVESNDWVNVTALSNTYNNNAWLTETLNMNWTDSTWKPANRTLYDVDADNMVHAVVYQNADTLDEFVNTVKAQYDYDERGLCTFIEEYSWVNGDWEANTWAKKNEKVFWDERLSKEDELARCDNTYWNIGNTTIEWMSKVVYPINTVLDEQRSDDITIYPNPVLDVLTVKTSKPNVYRIINLTGQVLQSGTINGLIRQIDIKELPVGVYFIIIGESSRKFIKT